MTERFFEQPVLNSPYEYPGRHWELDEAGQPTGRVVEARRAEFLTPIPKPKKRRPAQREMVFDEGRGLSTEAQQYDPTPVINELRVRVDRWRELANPNDWQVTPETARLLQHWRHHRFEPHTLRINYRTSHQIRSRADRLLPVELSDVDGTREDRRGTISVFNGPEPEVRVFEDAGQEAMGVAAWLRRLIDEGFALDEIALFVRTGGELERARAAADSALLPSRLLDHAPDDEEEAVAIGTMHHAKGLEFRAVAVLACDDEVLPLQSRIEAVADAADLKDAYETERHTLNVVCTRARDRLLVTGVAPGSEFLEDLGGRQ